MAVAAVAIVAVAVAAVAIVALGNFEHVAASRKVYY